MQLYIATKSLDYGADSDYDPFPNINRFLPPPDRDNSMEFCVQLATMLRDELLTSALLVILKLSLPDQ